MTLTSSDIDVGKIVELEEADDGYTLIIHEDGADFEIGFPVYKDDLNNFVPEVGADVTVAGHGTDEGIRYLRIDEEVIFDRTQRQALAVREVRKRERQIAQLTDEINTIEADVADNS